MRTEFRPGAAGRTGSGIVYGFCSVPQAPGIASLVDAYVEGGLPDAGRAPFGVHGGASDARRSSRKGGREFNWLGEMTPHRIAGCSVIELGDPSGSLVHQDAF